MHDRRSFEILERLFENGECFFEIGKGLFEIREQLFEVGERLLSGNEFVHYLHMPSILWLYYAAELSFTYRLILYPS